MSPKLYLEILDPGRRKLFSHLRSFRPYGFLAGGTALALQIYHRHSYDFDIFCRKEISSRLLQEARQIFSVSQLLVNTSDEFTFLTKENVKITFLYYPFAFSGNLVPCSEGLPLLNVLNIATSKAYTLGRRGNFRDYVDLYFVVRFHKGSLGRIIANAQKVYGELFSPKLFLGQLVYVEDFVEKEIKTVQFVDEPVSVDKIYSFFRNEVRKYQQEKFR